MYGLGVFNIVGDADQFYHFKGAVHGSAPAVVVNKTSGTFMPNAGANLFRSATLTLQNGRFAGATGGVIEVGYFEGASSLEVLNIQAVATLLLNDAHLKIIGKTYGACGAKNWIIRTPNTQFKDVTLNVIACGGLRGSLGLASGTYLNVGGRLTVVDTVLTGDYHVAGDIDIANDKLATNVSSSASIIFSGNQNQTFSNTSTMFLNKEFKIDKSSGTVTLATDMNLQGAGQDININSGRLVLNGKALTVNRKIVIGTAGILDASMPGSKYTPSSGSNLENNGVIIPSEQIAELGK